MATLVFTLLSLLGSCSFLWAADEPNRLVAIVDYVAGDYKNAVRGGKVINPDEYREMVEFSARAIELTGQLRAAEQADKAGVEGSITALAARIKQKGDEKDVSELARQIKEKLLTAYNIVPYPRGFPTLQAGRVLYGENCAACHGESGRGDGPSRETMKPKEPAPANFTDPEIMATLSPFKVFNIVSFGIEGTAMASFAALSEEERWQVAFYIFSLRFAPDEAAAGKTLLAATPALPELKQIKELSTQSDGELQAKLSERFRDETEAVRMLAYLRRGALEEAARDPLIAARALLREAAELYKHRDRQKAYQKAVDAYLDGFELLEPQLFAKDLSLGREIESLMGRFRNALKQGKSVTAVEALYQEIDADLARAQQVLEGGEPVSGSYLFLNAMLIILREGLEASLILAAVLATLKVTGEKIATRYIHLGWILALGAGFVTWILAQTLLTISGSHRESLEGLTTLVAALVLFYVGYWLHTKAEAVRWQQFIHETVHRALSGRRILTLVGVSFFTVYREAFEVVLFYQALWLQNPGAPQPVIWGFLGGLAVLGCAIFALLRLGLKIPLKYFFGLTGGLIFLLAVVFAGQGVKELQIAGWFSVTPLRFPPQVSVLGLYPTVETLAAQLCVLILAGLFWIASRNQPEGSPS
jgi:high-affinity iron transporter